MTLAQIAYDAVITAMSLQALRSAYLFGLAYVRGE